MSFIDKALDVLSRTEASLHSVIADALAAKAYKEIAAIAAMAEAVAAITASRSPEEKQRSASAAEENASAPPAGTDTTRVGEPSWMRPKA
jgi:hypothetical protein